MERGAAVEVEASVGVEGRVVELEAVGELHGDSPGVTVAKGDEDTVAASWPADAMRHGGVMLGLSPNASSISPNHGQDAAVSSPPSVLTPVLGAFSLCGTCTSQD